MMDNKVYQALLETFHDELKSCYQELVDTLILIERVEDSQLSSCFDVLFRSAHNVKGAARSVGLDDIVSLSHHLEDQFSIWRDNHDRPSKAQIDQSLLLCDQLLSRFEDQFANKGGDSIKIPLSRIEEANVKSDEFVMHQLRHESCLNELVNLKEKLSFDKNIYDCVSDVVEKYRSINVDFLRDMRLLQSSLREMRLMPISTILDPMQKVVRELSEKMNKKIKLCIEGGDIELDKMILDAVRDPLHHLLRNAIDHGIESKEDRKKLNKSDCGAINIRVYQEYNEIKLSFKDDGSGVDLKKVKEKALKNNIVDERELDSLSRHELLMLITRPGFSTSSLVSEISGRGVGLDVVVENIQSVKGRIEINSELGKGSEFMLTLPLTLAMTRGLFVRCAEALFMLSSVNIDGIYTIDPNDFVSIGSDCVITINDHTMPVRRLDGLLSMRSVDGLGSSFYGIKLSDKNQAFVFLVDAIEDEHDCVIKPMPFPFNKVALYSGITLSGDKQLVPVLNHTCLLELASSSVYSSFSFEKSEVRNKVQRHILVVDDSLTTRSLTANALRAEGYVVETAADGQLAWELLSEHEFDGVVTDIEMPNMDGFTLTSTIKQDETLKHIPVVIVSSHEDLSDREKGKACGASVYLVKSKFSTHVLLETLESVL